MTLTSNLKEHTKASHQQLEKILVARMRGIDSEQGYIDLLQLFYTYFGGLEKKIDLYINELNLPGYSLRRKTGLLAADIKSFGGQTNILAEANALPGITNHLQAFGALYVIEGSTLGGSIISKMMAKQLDIADGAGLSFFLGYGDDTVTMWEAFKRILDKQTQNKDEETVIDAADHTFIKFKEWIERDQAQ